MKLLCAILGHDPEYHLGSIWGTLLRDHGVCKRCDRTTRFEKPSDERVAELEKASDLFYDCTNDGCKLR